MLTQFGTLPLLILQAIALVALIAAIFGLRGIRRAAVAGAHMPFTLVTVATILVGISTLLSALAFTQEKTGKSLGVSGGISSDARAWVTQHEMAPPARNDVGTNLRTLADAVAWLKAHQSQLDPAGLAKLTELGDVPEKPKRLLTVSEEARYFQAADSGYNYIRSLAGTGTAAATTER